MNEFIWELSPVRIVVRKFKFRAVFQGRKIGGALNAFVKREILNVEYTRSLHEGVLVPNLMYECETLVYIGWEW